MLKEVLSFRLKGEIFGFYVQKVGQSDSIEYFVVSAEPTKVREVYYLEPPPKNWTGKYGSGAIIADSEKLDLR